MSIFVERLKELEEFESAWTKKGIPNEPELRSMLGFFAGRLLSKGCEIELLLDYLREAMERVEGIVGSKKNSDEVL